MNVRPYTEEKGKAGGGHLKVIELTENNYTERTGSEEWLCVKFQCDHEDKRSCLNLVRKKK